MKGQKGKEPFSKSTICQIVKGEECLRNLFYFLGADGILGNNENIL